ncbi:hypothetical protein GQ53DRAFT_531902 [Thozetella sp. PMI_491]|nr:hypothetical protein GQ53DRAFT_531902 [Thozetella sp. PMI_491]
MLDCYPDCPMGRLLFAGWTPGASTFPAPVFRKDAQKAKSLLVCSLFLASPPSSPSHAAPRRHSAPLQGTYTPVGSLRLRRSLATDGVGSATMQRGPRWSRALFAAMTSALDRGNFVNSSFPRSHPEEGGRARWCWLRTRLLSCACPRDAGRTRIRVCRLHSHHMLEGLGLGDDTASDGPRLSDPVSSLIATGPSPMTDPLACGCGGEVPNMSLALLLGKSDPCLPVPMHGG